MVDGDDGEIARTKAGLEIPGRIRQKLRIKVDNRAIKKYI